MWQSELEEKFAQVRFSLGAIRGGKSWQNTTLWVVQNWLGGILFGYYLVVKAARKWHCHTAVRVPWKVKIGPAGGNRC